MAFICWKLDLNYGCNYFVEFYNQSQTINFCKPIPIIHHVLHHILKGYPWFPVVHGETTWEKFFITKRFPLDPLLRLLIGWICEGAIFIWWENPIVNISNPASQWMFTSISLELLHRHYQCESSPFCCKLNSWIPSIINTVDAKDKNSC